MRTLIDEIASAAVLEAAFDWLCHSRRHAPDNHPVWHLRLHWTQIKARL